MPCSVQRVLESEDNDKLTNGSLSITSFINVFGQRYIRDNVIIIIIYLEFLSDIKFVGYRLATIVFMGKLPATRMKECG
jgi:hypothetical protein